MKSKLLAFIFRFGGISGKFLLVFLITKNISLEFQGEYTLLSTNLALLIIVLGLDFYIYSNRIIVKEPENLMFIFKNSLVFYAAMYLMFIPILLGIVYLKLVPPEIALVFFCLVIVEHLSQELFRIYIALENVILANILFFLRTGAWSWPIVFYLYFIDNDLTLSTIFLAWFLLSLVSTIVGVILLPGLKSFKKEKIDKKWIKKGIQVGLMMFVATIFLKIIEYSDRYFINYYLGKKELGIYAFFYQFSNIINVIIFTLYISYAYPRILKSVYNTNTHQLKTEKVNLFKNTMIIVVGFSCFSYFLLPYFLDYIGKSELTSNIGLIYILILAALFFNLSFSNHFVLVALERERLIIKATVFACIFNVVFNIVLIPHFGIYGSAMALLISSFMLFLTKLIYVKKVITWEK